MDDTIFKAYDVRGIYPDQMDEELAYRIGRGFAQVLSQLQDVPVAELRVALGHDMRLSAPSMTEAYARGIADEGADVLDIGMVGTEMLYWTVGSRELDGGLMCTASHNPAAYTGAKLVKRGAIALSGDSGIGELKEIVSAGEPGAPADPPGSSSRRTTSPSAFREAALGYIDPSAIKPLKVVVDGGNGMAGPMVGPLLDSFPIEQERTYWEPDGTFPDHEPNPLLEENRRFIIERVRETGADLGIAWDGDADRCFFIDDTGEFVAGDFLTALLAESILRKEPARRSSTTCAPRARCEIWSRRAGGSAEGQPRRTRVLQDAHARHRRRLRRRGVRALLLPRLLLRRLRDAAGAAAARAAVGRGRRLSELLEPLRSKYFISGEINSEVEDQDGKMNEIAERYSDGEVS